MSTPTRIPDNVPVRAAVLSALAAVLLTVLLTPDVSAATGASTAALRADRQVLVRRVAALADEAERAHARAGDAARRQLWSQFAFDIARRRFAARVVGAYIEGTEDNETDQLRGKAWAGALGEVDRLAISELRDAKEAAVKDGATAKVAASEARKVAADLESTRRTLERTINDRDAIASKAARRSVTTRPSRVPRHQRATAAQDELMRRYHFGPGGVPTGLVRNGQVIDGRASWYGPGFDGRATASGAIYDQEGWTVAHKTLPLGTILLITANGRSVVALVNDRGPFVAGRVLDLSHGVANALGTLHAGVAPVRAEILVEATP